MFRRKNRPVIHRLLFLLLISISLSFIFITFPRQQTISYPSTILDQTIIIIRTSHYCQSRLNYLRQSWLPTDLSQQSNIYLITDNLSNYSNQTLLHSFKNIIETNCPQRHNQLDLCCKTSHEFELFYNISQINSNLQWMCRFDDDQYVNLHNLYQFLSPIDSSKAYYLGRTSVNNRLKVPKHHRTYRFATYGAGVCFSRPLLSKLRPYVNQTIFPSGCKQHGLSDDGYIGYLIEFILNISLTTFNKLFHSHLENLNISFRSFTIEYLQNAITFGFAWDRYKLSWLPIIHQLIQLINHGEKNAAKHLWKFLQNYEQEHPEDSNHHYDQSCTSYPMNTRHKFRKI